MSITTGRLGFMLALGPTLLTSALLSACGGGGSSGGDNTPTPTIYRATCADGSIKTSSYSLADAQSFCKASLVQ